jgi:hypothetical protein
MHSVQAFLKHGNRIIQAAGLLMGAKRRSRVNEGNICGCAHLNTTRSGKAATCHDAFNSPWSPYRLWSTGGDASILNKQNRRRALINVVASGETVSGPPRERSSSKGDPRPRRLEKTERSARTERPVETERSAPLQSGREGARPGATPRSPTVPVTRGGAGQMVTKSNTRDRRITRILALRDRRRYHIPLETIFRGPRPTCR